MLRTAELDYHLPPDLIATRPAEPRDACRLMVVSRTDDSLCEHVNFRDVGQFLRAGDLLVFNTSSVLPARFFGARLDTGGKVEGLFVRAEADDRWSVLLKTKSKLSEGVAIALHAANDANGAEAVRFILTAKEAGGWWVRVLNPDATPSTRPPGAVLDAIGATPLPPYILKARREAHTELDDRLDRDWYQTVYADPSQARSVAAPTAGLHFTPELLAALAASGVQRADVRLHVGLGTFKPIDTEFISDHPIHSEEVSIDAQAIRAIRTANREARRVICVGTTSVRAVESLPANTPEDARYQSPTSLFITPGYEWKRTNALITNFHLPRSTLLALVGAMFAGGLPRLLDLYRIAVDRRYRFYSYGDAMLILP